MKPTLRRTALTLLTLATSWVAALAQAQVGAPVNIVDAKRGTKAVVQTNGGLNVNVLTLPTGGMNTVNQGNPNTVPKAWPVVPYPAPVGTQANAWNAATVTAGAFSATVDCQFAPFIDVFGTTGSAGTVMLQESQDGVHFYITDSVTVSGASDFGFHVIMGARYGRVGVSAPTVITATIAGKT